jgi:beta-glucosidase
VHHLNLAHGLAAAAVREVAPAARVGVTLNLAWVRPESDSAADLDAARRCDGLQNRVFLDPILHGGYPADVLADTAAVTDWGSVRAGDAETIAAPLDVLGLNYYSPLHVRHWTRERPRETADGHGDSAATPWIACDDVEFPRRPGPTTAMGWGIDPRGMTELLLRIARERPDLDLMITENGAAFPDAVGADGIVHDDDRVEYLRGHLAEAVRDRARRLRHAGAHPEGQRAVLRAVGARQRRPAVVATGRSRPRTAAAAGPARSAAR